MSISRPLAVAALALLVLAAGTAGAADALPSWNDGGAKRAIVAFVEKVTRQGGPDFVPEDDRIAVFDNDGTLWAEQPLYFQFVFALDRIKVMAPRHPEWKTTQPYQAVLEGDREALLATGQKGLVELVTVSHSGMTTEEFQRIVDDWFASAKHPRFNVPYTQLTYQPMVELLNYLRGNGFQTFIVSGGGVEFMRAWAEQAYGIPPQQVVGSSGVTRFERGKDGKPVLIKTPQVEFVDDGPGKPAGINRFIGRRPLFAFGNSDGDLQMLQWTTAGAGPRFAAILHHTDADREYAYDRKSFVGKLDKALDEAGPNGWTVVDMKNDWKRVFTGVTAP